MGELPDRSRRVPLAMAPNVPELQTPVKQPCWSPSEEAEAPSVVSILTTKDEAALLKDHEGVEDLESSLEFEQDLDPTRELTQLLALAYPMMATYVFEFLPELVCVSLVGHIDSSETQKYVDGAMLSIMVRDYGSSVSTSGSNTVSL